MTPTPAFLDGIGFSEMLLIAFIAILVFGGKLPDALKNVGRGYAKFRKSIQDVSRPLREEIQRATTLPPEAYTPALPSRGTPTAPPGTAAPTDVSSGLRPGGPAPYGVGVAAPAADPFGTLTPPAAPPAGAPPSPDQRPAGFDDEPPPV